MLDRCKNLLHDDIAFSWLKRAYSLRDEYLHGYGDPRDKTSWEDVAKIRWAVGQVVDRYLALTEARSSDNRKALLRSLEK
jgi:hypothetical protein